MNDDSCPKPVWIEGVLYVPVLDREILDALRRSPDVRFGHGPEDVLRVEQTSRNIWLAGRNTRLTRTEFALLVRLMEAQNQVVSSEAVLQSVWGAVPARSGADLLRTHIRNLRIKLAEVGVPDRALVNVRGQGYRFRFSVEMCDLPALVYQSA